MVVFSYVLMTILMFMGLFLIGLILLQRGRGGGLAGAFGGMGGQSAFGTKAGDVFTRITIGVAAAWILLCATNVIALHKASDTTRADSSTFRDDSAASSADGTLKAPPKDENSAGGPAKTDLPPASGDSKPADDAKTEEAKTDESKKEDAKSDESKKQEEKKQEEAKQEEAKKDDASKQQEAPKQDEEKKTEPPKTTETAPPADEKPAEKNPPEQKPAEPEAKKPE